MTFPEELLPFFLLPIAPSLAFGVASGYVPWTIPSLLLLYWGGLPPLLYRLGPLLPALARKFPKVRSEVYALTLPYVLYWPLCERLGVPLRRAVGGFLMGPGLGLPLASLLGVLLGEAVPPFWVSVGVVVVGILLERVVLSRRRHRD